MKTSKAVATAALAVAFMGGAALPAAASTTPTKAQAKADAAKVNLVAADLPGWKESPNPNTPADLTEGNKLAACVGAPSPSRVDIVNINSPYFDQGNADVTSSVDVVRAPSVGVKDLAAMKSANLLPCEKAIGVPYLKAQAGKGVTLSGVTINKLHPAWLPPSSFAYRISLTITAKAKGGGTQSVGLVSDNEGFLVGQLEVGLTATEVSTAGNVKPSASLEQRLVNLLHKRADKVAG